MINREEYEKYISELTKKDVNNPNLKYVSKGYKSSAGVMMTVGIIMLFVGFFGTIILSIIGAVLFGFGIFRMVKVGSAQKYYKENYSKKVLDFLLKDNDYTFDEFGKIEEYIFKNSQMGTTNHYDYYKGEDLLSINIPNDDGSKSNNYLHLCDLDVTKIESDSDGDDREVTVYKGVFGYVDFPFEFKCSMSINTTYRKPGVKFEKISLEDIVFNKKFKVLSNDQIESRYILTPEMMEKLLILNEKAGKVRLVLVDDKMYFGFSSIDLFELKSVSNNNVESLFDNFYTHVSVILSIVNEIKNNNKIFKI